MKKSLLIGIIGFAAGCIAGFNLGKKKVSADEEYFECFDEDETLKQDEDGYIYPMGCYAETESACKCENHTGMCKECCSCCSDPEEKVESDETKEEVK